jgi:hypothetical protein
MLIYESSKRDIVDHCKSLGFTNSETQAYLSYVQRKEQAIQNGGIKGLTNRDSDTHRVYRSEWAFQKEYEKIRTFKNEQEAQKRLDQILASECWYKLCGPHVVLEFVSTKKNMAGSAFTGGLMQKHIRLNVRCGMSEYTLLHELSHHLPLCFNHSIDFRVNLLKLVSSFMGRDAAKILKQKFKENKLKLSHSKPQSPETWIKGVERAAMLRERRAQKQVI